MAKARAHLIITGMVQGVMFRYSTQDEAERLGLTGWVRNRRDGTVEAVAEGEKQKVEQLVEWCHHGPPHARVSRVDVHWEEPGGEFEGFKIGWTA